jgi:hypothetical protein
MENKPKPQKKNCISNESRELAPYRQTHTLAKKESGLGGPALQTSRS